MKRYVSKLDPCRSEWTKLTFVPSSTFFALQIANLSVAIRNARTKRDFLQSFADEPREFVHRWLESQARDLGLALGVEKPDGIAGTGLGKEDLRKSDTFLLPWVSFSLSNPAIKPGRPLRVKLTRFPLIFPRDRPRKRSS